MEGDEERPDLDRAATSWPAFARELRRLYHGFHGHLSLRDLAPLVKVSFTTLSALGALEASDRPDGGTNHRPSADTVTKIVTNCEQEAGPWLAVRARLARELPLRVTADQVLAELNEERDRHDDTRRELAEARLLVTDLQVRLLHVDGELESARAELDTARAQRDDHAFGYELHTKDPVEIAAALARLPPLQAAEHLLPLAAGTAALVLQAMNPVAAAERLQPMGLDYAVWPFTEIARTTPRTAAALVESLPTAWAARLLDSTDPHLVHAILDNCAQPARVAVLMLAMNRHHIALAYRIGDKDNRKLRLSRNPRARYGWWGVHALKTLPSPLAARFLSDLGYFDSASRHLLDVDHATATSAILTWPAPLAETMYSTLAELMDHQPGGTLVPHSKGRALAADLRQALDRRSRFS